MVSVVSLRLERKTHGQRVENAKERKRQVIGYTAASKSEQSDGRGERPLLAPRRREEGGVGITRLRRAMALRGRTSVPFFKNR